MLRDVQSKAHSHVKHVSAVGSTFTAGSGAATETAPCSVTMTAATSVNRNLPINTYACRSQSWHRRRHCGPRARRNRCGRHLLSTFSHGTTVTTDTPPTPTGLDLTLESGGCNGTGTWQRDDDCSHSGDRDLHVNTYALSRPAWS